MIQTKKIFEDEKKLNNNIGVMHQRAGNHDQASEYLAKAMYGEKTPAQEFGLNFNMAMTLMQTNRSEEALKHLLKCLELIKFKD